MAGEIAYGSDVKIGAATVAEVVDITGPGTSTDQIDTTHMGSASRWAEKLPGIIEGGVVTVTANFLKTDAAYVMIWGYIGTQQACEIAHGTLILGTGAGRYTFSANVDVSVAAAVRDKMTLTITLAITGLITRTTS